MQINAPGERPSDPKLGLRAKLVRVYALQVVLISLAALVGVYITYLIVEDLLTREALVTEAEHYWELYDADPSQPLPNTNNMRGYLAGPGIDAEIPAPLPNLSPGFGEVDALPQSPLVHVSEQEGKTLYLVFDREQVSELVFYFGLAPLAAMLLSVYALLFLTYRLSQQAISPILSVAKSLEQFDFRQGTMPANVAVPETMP